MPLHRKLIPLLALFMFSASLASAQRYIGLETCDWSAINTVYLNPATIAGCHEKISIGLFSYNFLVDNNLGTFSKLTLTGAVNSGNSNFKLSGRQDFSMLLPSFELRGPGVMVAITKNMSLALTTDFRIMNQFNNFGRSLYNLITNTSAISNTNYTVTSKNFNWTANMWTEIGLTFGAVVLNNEKNEVKLGITVRRLGGVGYISVTGRNLDIKYTANADSFYASNSDIEFASNIVSDNTAVFQGINESNLLSRVFGANDGTGLSTDIGFVYKRRIGESEPSDYNEDLSNHNIVFSGAITDFGSINYNAGTNAVIDVSGNGYITGAGISKNAGSTSTFINYANQQGFHADTSSQTTKVYMPAALVFSLDAQAYGPIYVNLLYISNIANRLDFGNSYYNQLTLTPRFDYHRMTLALPITYSMLANNIKIGFAYRIGGFFFGSDDALALLSKNQYGFNIYMGGYIPIFRKNTDPAGLHWSY